MLRLLKMSLISTTAMTLFSCIMSINKKQTFIEPLVLNKLLFPKKKNSRRHHILGYIGHFSVGLLFSSVYKLTWERSPVSEIEKNSGTMGLINGLAGISGWHIFFLANPDPPKVPLKKYYLQLLAAHVIFGLANGWTFKKIKKVEGQQQEFNGLAV
jgi:hypothetical protein